MLPVTRLAVDTVAITQVIGDYSCCCGRGMTDQLFVCPGAKACCLFYQQVRFWDGLLSQDWIGSSSPPFLKLTNSPAHVLTEAEPLKREASFCTFRPLNILMYTWNIANARPDMLMGPGNASFFKTHLQSMENPDIIMFSLPPVRCFSFPLNRRVYQFY